MTFFYVSVMEFLPVTILCSAQRFLCNARACSTNTFRTTMGRIRRVTQPSDPKVERATVSAVGDATAGFDLDIRLREFEINQLTQRNNFFMIFQGVMIAGVMQSGGTAAPLISFLVCLTGMGISLLQVGMAGGAKYWQVRWEAATRSSELAILLALLKAGRDSTQTFIQDLNLLPKHEKDLIDAWNASQADPANQIGDWPNFVHDQVELDVRAGKRGPRYWLDWWVRAWGILPKWSVSRIPIWAGGVLFLFWCVLWLHTFSLPGLTEHIRWQPTWFELTPLKPDPKDDSRSTTNAPGAGQAHFLQN
jgi:hypothetical protein